MSKNIPESDIDFEYIKRDKALENSNIKYASSIKGRIFTFLDILPIKTASILFKVYNFTKVITLKFIHKVDKGLDILAVFLYNEYCNNILRKDIKKMSESNNNITDKNIKSNSEKVSKQTKNKSLKSFTHGIMGIMTLFVVVSIAYSSWVIVQGTEDQIHRIMIMPMVIWAVATLVKQFLKQGDE